MAVAKVIEVTASSPDSFEAAIRDGIKRAGETVQNIEGAWIKEQKVVIENSEIISFRVDMMVTFLLSA